MFVLSAPSTTVHVARRAATRARVADTVDLTDTADVPDTDGAGTGDDRRAAARFVGACGTCRTPLHLTEAELLDQVTGGPSPVCWGCDQLTSVAS